jgi:hypothetical protein
MAQSWEGQLAEDLAPARDGLTDPTTVQVMLWERGPDGTLRTGATVQVVNRSIYLGCCPVPAGTYVAGVTINGERRILWSDA